MKRFRYALDPALAAARGEEAIAARAFVDASRDVEHAQARVDANVAAAFAIVSAAANAERIESDDSAPRSPRVFLDRERCLRALAVRRSLELASATAAEHIRVEARARYDAGVLRRRVLETHRGRALARDRAAREAAEASEFDAANASSRGAGRRANGSSGP